MQLDDSLDSSFEHFPLVDALDHEILMHRDAHFGGLFSVMIDYYQTEGKGVQPQFSLQRIEKLQQLEKELKQNLAATFLSADEIQKVADAREAYRQLRKIYEIASLKSPHPKLIADLILSEEQEATQEIAAIVAQGSSIVKLLIDLLKNEQFHDPLYPGYGVAPSLVVECLGQIGDKRAIICLFEAIGGDDFFADDAILKALKAIGSPAKEFLLRVVAGRPLNEDNEKAALALVAFKEEEVAERALQLLREPDIWQDEALSTYLILSCEGLQKEISRADFALLAHGADRIRKQDICSILNQWKN